MRVESASNHLNQLRHLGLAYLRVADVECHDVAGSFVSPKRCRAAPLVSGTRHANSVMATVHSRVEVAITLLLTNWLPSFLSKHTAPTSHGREFAPLPSVFGKAAVQATAIVREECESADSKKVIRGANTDEPMECRGDVAHVTRDDGDVNDDDDDGGDEDDDDVMMMMSERRRNLKKKALVGMFPQRTILCPYLCLCVQDVRRIVSDCFCVVVCVKVVACVVLCSCARAGGRRLCLCSLFCGKAEACANVCLLERAWN